MTRMIIIFVIALIIGIITYDAIGCNSWMAFVVGLISGVFANIISSFIDEIKDNKTVLKRLEGNRAEIRAVFTEQPKTWEAATLLLKHSEPEPSVKTKINRVVELFIESKEPTQPS